MVKFSIDNLLFLVYKKKQRFLVNRLHILASHIIFNIK